MSGALNLGVLGTATRDKAEEPSKPVRVVLAPSPIRVWNQESFAKQQIQNLVRQVFFSKPLGSVRQVVFAAVDPDTDVESICTRVGEMLARETPQSVAVIPECEIHDQEVVEVGVAAPDTSLHLQRMATRLHGNVWLLPPPALHERSSASLHSYLAQLRRDFEFSILAAPAPGSQAATAMAEFSDGVILVLSEHRTRRAAAWKVKQSLDAVQARLLGAVLADRTFPIPERIYRRL